MATGDKVGDQGTEVEDQEPQTWKALWYDYSQNTTFHGIPYVMQDAHFVLRRYSVV